MVKRRRLRRLSLWWLRLWWLRLWWRRLRWLRLRLRYALRELLQDWHRAVAVDARGEVGKRTGEAGHGGGGGATIVAGIRRE